MRSWSIHFVTKISSHKSLNSEHRILNTGRQAFLKSEYISKKYVVKLQCHAVLASIHLSGGGLLHQWGVFTLSSPVSSLVPSLLSNHDEAQNM